MSTANQTADPVLSLKKRPDLVVSEQWLSGRHHWVIKDPVTMKYFHLGDEDYAVLGMLDGNTSLAQLRQQYEKQFAPKQLPNHWLQSILRKFHDDALVISTAENQAEQLLLRRDKQRWQQRLQAATSLLAIRFRGFDPERFLSWLYPKCRWLLSMPMLLLMGLLIVSALMLAAFNFPVMLQRMPQVDQYFTAQSIITLLIVLAAVKVLHEFGHALACKHYGGECHELGLMLLVFMPCLYCDVSDSWLLKSRWRRIAIAAGGMMVELALAAMATWLWWLSVPGFFNSLCFHVMLVCSVSTILFNGNPLLKYDGYYIMSDLVAIPNLADKAQRELYSRLSKLCLGIDLYTSQAHHREKPRLLLTYAIAALLYRTFIIASIFLILYGALKPLGLQSVAYFIIGMTLSTLFFSMFIQVKQMAQQQTYQQQFNRRRLTGTLAIVGSLLVAIFIVPLPQKVSAPAMLSAEDATSIYVTNAGNVSVIQPVGKSISLGEQIALLEDWDIQLAVAQLQQSRDEKQAALQTLALRRLEDPAADKQYSVVEAELKSVQEGLEKLKQDQQALKITAPTAGVILPPIWKNTSTQPQSEKNLRTWNGSPFEKRNRGCYLPAGHQLCQIGDPHRLEALLIIDQNDIQLVRQQQSVKIQLLQNPSKVIEGEVVEISEIDLEQVPDILAAQGDIATQKNESGGYRPSSTSYLARVQLKQQDATLLIRARGQAKITVDPQPLGTQIYRWLSRTFRFGA